MTQPPTDPYSGSPPGAPSFLPGPPQYAAHEDPYQFQNPALPDEPTSPYMPQAAPDQPMSPYMPQAQPITSYPSAYRFDPEPAAQSPFIGILGLGLVLVGAVAYFVCWYVMFAGMFNLVDSGAINSTSPFDLQPDLVRNFYALVIGITVSSMAGIAGLVLSIIGTAQDRGRPYGIAGIVLGALAPFSLYIAAFAAYPGY